MLLNEGAFYFLLLHVFYSIHNFKNLIFFEFKAVKIIFVCATSRVRYLNVINVIKNNFQTLSNLKNFVKVSYGASVGWVSPALKQLTSKDSPLASGPITIEGSPISN